MGNRSSKGQRKKKIVGKESKGLKGTKGRNSDIGGNNYSEQDTIQRVPSLDDFPEHDAHTLLHPSAKGRNSVEYINVDGINNHQESSSQTHQKSAGRVSTVSNASNTSNDIYLEAEIPLASKMDKYDDIYIEPNELLSEHSTTAPKDGINSLPDSAETKVAADPQSSVDRNHTWFIEPQERTEYLNNENIEGFANQTEVRHAQSGHGSSVNNVSSIANDDIYLEPNYLFPEHSTTAPQDCKVVADPYGSVDRNQTLFIEPQERTEYINNEDIKGFTEIAVVPVETETRRRRDSHGTFVSHTTMENGLASTGHHTSNSATEAVDTRTAGNGRSNNDVQDDTGDANEEGTYINGPAFMGASVVENAHVVAKRQSSSDLEDEMIVLRSKDITGSDSKVEPPQSPFTRSERSDHANAGFTTPESRKATTMARPAQGAVAMEDNDVQPALPKKRKKPPLGRKVLCKQYTLRVDSNGEPVKKEIDYGEIDPREVAMIESDSYTLVFDQ